ncbi:MAG: hypothetical protein AB8B71_00180 [Paracoccaceae bacterium]
MIFFIKRSEPVAVTDDVPHPVSQDAQVIGVNRRPPGLRRPWLGYVENAASSKTSDYEALC